MNDLLLFELPPPVWDIYHNTTGLKGNELIKRQLKAGSQNDAILKFFNRYPCRDFNPFEVWDAMKLPRTPRSSVQRAMTDLTKLGYLVKTDNMRPGEFDNLTHCWKLK